VGTTELKELADWAAGGGETILAVAPRKHSTVSVVVLTYDRDNERWHVYPRMIAMRHRDQTFMQWSSEEAPKTFQTGIIATEVFKEAIW
jgi:hypothetical protein